MTARTYPSPRAFKAALEARMRNAVPSGQLTRFRQRLVFERFLARVFAELGDRVVAKGGIVLELRLERARTTRDIDLRLTGEPARILDDLKRAGQCDLGDHLSFAVDPDGDHPTLRSAGMAYEGLRFRVEGRLAGKLYGMPFGVDVGLGDILTRPPDLLAGTDFLEFVGVEPARFRVYPREAHVAEKLHAFTLPRLRENSRVKDLPDLALLATTGPFDLAQLRLAITATFRFRATHELPDRLPDPPLGWTPTYARLATSDLLPWPTLAEVTAAARGFLDPVLAGGVAAAWDPAAWRWAI